MRIRHLMIAVVYVAVTLILIMAAREAQGPLRFVIAPVFFLAIPFALATLSFLILPPGPRRDWICALLWVHAFAGLILLHAVLFIPYFVQHQLLSSRGSDDRIVGFLNVVNSVIFMLVGAWPMVKLLRYLIPSHCPQCERKRLLNAAWFVVAGGKKRCDYFRCVDCDEDLVIKRSQYGRGCPQCGRPQIRRRPYSFYWCLNCRARVKRLPNASWEPVRSPEEDGFYSLWDSGDWLRLLVGRATKSQ